MLPSFRAITRKQIGKKKVCDDLAGEEVTALDWSLVQTV